MNLIGFNPASIWEAVANGKLARHEAISITGAMFSANISFLEGLSSMPFFGKGCLRSAAAMKLCLLSSSLCTQHEMVLSYPQTLDDPDLLSLFVTTWKEKP